MYHSDLMNGSYGVPFLSRPVCGAHRGERRPVFILTSVPLAEDIGGRRTARVVVHGTPFLSAFRHETLKTASSAF
jgi:hypothetical protein